MLIAIDPTSDRPVRGVDRSIDDAPTGEKSVGQGECFVRIAARNAVTCHLIWCKAVQTKTFADVDEDLILGEVEFVMTQILMQSRHYAPYARRPRSVKQWTVFMDRWVETKGAKMASLLPASEFPNSHAALLDTKSPLLVKARKQTRFLFSYMNDIRRSPLSDDEKAVPELRMPLLGTQEIVTLACERLRLHGYHMSLDECEVFPSSIVYAPRPSPISSLNEAFPSQRGPSVAAKLSDLTRRLTRRGSHLFSKQVHQRSLASATSSLPSVTNGEDLRASMPAESDEYRGKSGRAGKVEDTAHASDPSCPSPTGSTRSRQLRTPPGDGTHDAETAQHTTLELTRQRKASEASKTVSTTHSTSSDSDSTQPISTPQGGGASIMTLPHDTPDTTRRRTRSMAPVMEDKREEEVSK